MQRAVTLSFLMLLILVSNALAQERPDPKNPENANLEVPANWELRPDNPDPGVNISSNEEEADIFFVNMVPGWHITTGPAAIFWHPASTAEGAYRAETVIHLFDPEGRNEAFGLFFGGSKLNGEGQLSVAKQRRISCQKPFGQRNIRCTGLGRCFAHG